MAKSISEQLAENARNREAFERRTGIDPTTGLRYIDPATSLPYTAPIDDAVMLKDAQLLREEEALKAKANLLQQYNKDVTSRSHQHQVSKHNRIEQAWKSLHQSAQGGIAQAISQRPVGGAVAAVTVGPVLEIANLAAKLILSRRAKKINQEHGILVLHTPHVIETHKRIARRVARRKIRQRAGAFEDYIL